MQVKKVLIPIPSTDFDPTETAIPWKILKKSGFEVHFATPEGLEAKADHRMLTGESLGIWAKSLRATPIAVSAYQEMNQTQEFKKPLSYAQADFQTYDGVILPGGHAPGMKSYLESEILQQKVAKYFSQEKPLGAICHGVVLAARSKTENGKSVLHQRRVTALPKWMELSAWAMTCLWLGNYYRTYQQTVEVEVRTALYKNDQFECGPISLNRDDENHLNHGFVVCDKNLVTSRWPGDAHRFTRKLIELVTKRESVPH